MQSISKLRSLFRASEFFELDAQRMKSSLKRVIIATALIASVFGGILYGLGVFAAIDLIFVLFFLINELISFILMRWGKIKAGAIFWTVYSLIWLTFFVLATGGFDSPVRDIFFGIFMVAGYFFGVVPALLVLSSVIVLLLSMWVFDLSIAVPSSIPVEKLSNPSLVHFGIIIGISIITILVLNELRNAIRADKKYIKKLEDLERAHRVLENRYSSILDSAPNAIVTVDSHQKLILFNQKAEEIFGYSMEEVLGKHLEVLIPVDQHKGALTSLNGEFEKVNQAYLSTKLRNELVGRRKDASLFPLIARIAKVNEEEKTYFTIILTDLSEQKKTQQKLIATEEIYQDLYENVPIGLMITDEDGNIIKVNRAFAKMMGYPRRDDLCQFSIEELFVEGDYVIKQVRAALKNSHLFESEIQMIKKDASVIWVWASAEFKPGSDGQKGQFKGSFIDITERKNVEISLHNQFKRIAALRKIDRAISSTFDKSVVLEIILDEVVSQLNMDAADILLFNPLNDQLEYAAHRGFYTFPSKLKKYTISLENTMAGRAFLERKFFSVNDIANTDLGTIHPLQFEGDHFNAYFAAPFISKGNTIGVLEVFSYHAMYPDGDWLNFFEALVAQGSVALDNALLFENLQRSNMEIIRAYDATLEGWVQAIDMRDEETEHHSQRVTTMTLELAATMGISGEKLQHIKRGALLHDIGKIGVPDSILFKPGPLTDEEWKIMKQHPVLAHQFLASIPYLEMAVDIPYSHHERWDGSGYPRGLKGLEIPLAARIFSVVDVWDALCSDRPYRAAWPEDKVLAYLEEQAGIQFDPQVVEAFVALRMSKRSIGMVPAI